MAVTSNTYTGNGSTTNYSFTFEYLEQADVKVTLDGTATTAFTFANATTLSFTTAPASGVAIRIFRDTNIDNLKATFFPGSAIKAEDLNSNFTQNLYVTQETDADVVTANTTADTAKTTADAATVTANSATATANAATTTANTASTNASNAVTTANSAQTTVTTYVHDGTNPAGDGVGSNPQGLAYAINTANTASTNASAAVTTANTADANATTALNNSRESDGSGGYNTAIDKANTAVTTANTANTTANTASTNASSAVTTANTASTDASNALSTANAASAAVSNAVLFTLISNVASIPGSPSNNDYIEIGDSTNIGSFTPLSGLPSGFVGASGLTVRLRYDSSNTTWVWMSYFANDSEDRYLTKNNPVVTGDALNGSGQITLNCDQNTHGIKIKGPPHSAAATYTLTLPSDMGSNGQVLKTDGLGVTSWAESDQIGDGSGFAVVNLNSLNQDQLRVVLENQEVARHYYDHSNINTRQFFNDDMELRGDKHFRFQKNSGGGGAYTEFKKSQTATTSVAFTLPDADGTSGQAIVTDGSGVLSFADAGAPTIDGGNFDTGGSLVTTSNTIDGGSFD